MLDDVVASPGEEGAEAVAATVAPDGELYVSLDQALIDNCDIRVHRVVDDELEQEFVGRAPAFSPDGRYVAYLDDGYARFGEELVVPFCVRDLVVVRDIETGDERTWRHEPGDDIDVSDQMQMEDFYHLGGTPIGLDWSPDSTALAMVIAGEGFLGHTIDATAAELVSVPLTVSDDATAVFDAALPNGYGVTPERWTAAGDLSVIAYSYHWDGWASGRAVDGEVVGVTETSPEELTRFTHDEKEGRRLVVDRTDERYTLVVVGPDGTQREIMDDVATATWV